VVGHLALTPLALALDVVLLPVYVPLYVLAETGVIHGH